MISAVVMLVAAGLIGHGARRAYRAGDRRAAQLLAVFVASSLLFAAAFAFGGGR